MSNLFKQAKELDPDNVFSVEEMQKMLGGISMPRLYTYLKQAGMQTRKLADGTPYFTKEDYKKILFRGEGVVSNDESDKV